MMKGLLNVRVEWGPIVAVDPQLLEGASAVMCFDDSVAIEWALSVEVDTDE